MLNKSKCSLMIINRQKILPQPFQLISDIEEKEKSSLLGTLITNKDRCKEEIERRISMVNLERLSHFTKERKGI